MVQSVRVRRAGPDGGRRDAPRRRSRSRWTLIAALGLAIVVVVVALVLPAWRTGRSSATAGEAPRFVDETSAAGIDHPYDGEFEFFVGGGVAAFDCDDDGRAELFFAGGSEPAALYRNESPVGGALRFARQASPVTDLTAVTGAYPLDIDSDGHVDLAVLRRGGNVVLRGLRRLPLRGCERVARHRRRRRVDGCVQRDVGGLERAADAGVRQLPRCPTAPAATTANSCGRRRRATGTRRRSRSAPGTARCPSCSATGAGPASATCACRNDRHYYRDGEEQLWRIAPGEAPRRVHRGRRVAPVADLGHGHRQPGPDRRRLSRRCSSRARATTSCRRSTTARPDRRTGTSPSSAASPPTARSPAATCCRRPPGTRSSRTSTTTASSTCSSARATSRRSPTTRPAIRATCCIGQADGTFVEGAGGRRHRRLRPGPRRRAGRPQPRRDARPRRRQPPRARHAVAQRRQRRRRATGADGPLDRGPAPTAGAERRCHRCVGGGAGRRPHRQPARSPSAAGTPAASSVGSTPASVTRIAAEVRVQWPDGETGPWMTVGADQFVTIERGTAEAVIWQPSAPRIAAGSPALQRIRGRGVSDGDDSEHDEPSWPRSRCRSSGCP